MVRLATPVAFLATAVLIAVAPTPAAAQRTALAGEKARVAESVKRDLTRLAGLQRTYRGRTRTFATDPKDLNFTPQSGAEVTIAFASANAWAANASHDALAPVKCFVIVSASDAPDAATSQPFCTDAEPGSAAARVAQANAANPPAATKAPTTAPTKAPTSAPARTPATTPAATPATTPATTPGRSTPATRPPVIEQPVAAPVRTAAALSAREAAVRMITRDAGETALAPVVEPVSSIEFSAILAGLARDAVRVMDTPPPQLVRDPYESTPEFEQRKAAAMAEYERRESEWFANVRRSFIVQLPVRAVRYDADTEILEFAVDGLRLPSAREGRSQLTVACFTRPAFWCLPDSGMSYDANDLWKVPRATARRFDVLRTPMTLAVRVTVGGRPQGEKVLAISLVDLELQARGESVQRWSAR